jgi:hypothetical protein
LAHTVSAQNAVQCVAPILASQICLWLFDFKLKPIFATAPKDLKKGARFKKGQNQLKNNHLATII